MEKIQLDFDCEMKLIEEQVTSQAEIHKRMMIEKTKVMDQIYLTHKIRLADLMRGIEEYQLEGDPDVKEMKEAMVCIKRKSR